MGMYVQVAGSRRAKDRECVRRLGGGHGVRVAAASVWRLRPDDMYMCAMSCVQV